MKLNAFKFRKHNTAFKTDVDWRESAKETDWDTLPVYCDEQEEREEIPVQVTMRKGSAGKPRRGVLPKMQTDVRIRDRQQPRLPNDNARRTK